LAVVTINATPAFYANVLTTIILAVMLVLAIRIPFKKNYHYVLIVFILDFAYNTATGAIEQAALTGEGFLHWVRLQALLGGLGVLPVLLYLMVIEFRGLKPRAWQIVLMGALLGISLVYAIGNQFDFSFFIAGARSSQTGYTATAGPYFSYVSLAGIYIPGAIPILLIFYELIRHYRSTKSPLVHRQLEYLFIGVLVMAIAQLGGTFNNIFLLLPTGIKQFSQAVAVTILLVGWTRHGIYQATPTLEQGPRASTQFNLTEGKSYLGLDERASLTLFANLVKSGLQG
jgi:hypothetical protein